jgi:hypothetical protein
VLLSAVVVHAIGVAVNAQGVEARIASVNGRAVLSGNARTGSNLVRGVVVVPGDVIDTRAGGRVTIQLSDGSLVIVQPDSVVVFQDYRNAGSLRELLKITVGRVRVRINHFGGRPNPYRVNSPTASIAVRGTEFSVAVSAGGDTEVVVYEGLVEVASVLYPLHRVLVEAGHGVIIRANEDVRSFVPGLSKAIGERTSGGRGHDQESFDDADPSVPISKPSQDSLRTASGVYERYFDNVVENGEAPIPSRFAAFPDSHFDSIENPAFATDFTAANGRVFFLPSTGGTRENDNARQLFGLGDKRSVDYGLSPQGSFFVPLPGSRTVVGGRVAYSRDGFQSLTLDDQAGLTGPLFAPGTTGKRSVDGATTNRLFAASLMTARRIGRDGRTSVGFGVDYFSTRGKLFNTITQTDITGFSTSELIKSRSFANRTRLIVGMTRELEGGRKLALFYRYGSTSAEDSERSRKMNGGNRFLNRTSAAGHSSEIAFRLRGPFSHRFFYGIEGSYLFATTDENARRSGVATSLIRTNSQRATLGFGLGYVIRPRTVFSFDVAGGIAHINDARTESATSNLLERERKRAAFLSLHAALQADVWRRLFVSGSLLSVTQSRVSDLSLYPDRYGRVMTSDGLFQTNGRTSDRFTDYFSNVGLGWRFNRNFLGEYIFSTDFGQTSARHTLLFRYTFGRGENAPR